MPPPNHRFVITLAAQESILKSRGKGIFSPQDLLELFRLKKKKKKHVTLKVPAPISQAIYSPQRGDKAQLVPLV